MKKVIVAVVALVCLLLAFFYFRNKWQKPVPVRPAVPPLVQQKRPAPAGPLTLTYAAGENGTIKGARDQIVKQGGDGSQVTAVPAEHYHFVGWSDGITSANRIDHKVTKNLSVTAEFAIDRHNLTYGAEKGGTVKGIVSQSVAYGGDGTMVQAVPASGYHFLDWSDGVKTPSRTDSKVTADQSVTARFAVNKYTLTYAAGENGSIKGPSSQSVTYETDGNPVTAVPAAHYHFKGWSDGVTSASRTDRKVMADLSVRADFAVDQYTLTYIATDNGSISGTNPQTVTYGGDGTAVKALPGVGTHFVAWSDGVKTPERTDTKVVANLAVTAIFAINHYTLAYGAGDNGTINGAVSQSVTYDGSGSAVTAVPKKGYHFTGWSDGVATAQRSDSKVRGDLKVTALFAVNTYAVGGRVSGLAEGTQLVLQNNGGNNLTISTDGPFKFASELFNAHKYEVSVLTQPTSPNQKCTVAGGSGAISYADVADIAVTCVPLTYKVGGKVSGLAKGDRIVLRNNDADDLAVSTNGAFTFATPLNDGSSYMAKIFQQPERQNLICEAEKAKGVLKGKDVTDVEIACFPKLVLQTTAGKKKIGLSWNSREFPGATFNVCYAREEIVKGEFILCQSLKGGVLKRKVTSPMAIPLPDHDVPYWFQVQGILANGRKTVSDEVKGMSFGGLNDTGIDWCSDGTRDWKGTRSRKNKACRALAATYPGQDAVYGRDEEEREGKLKKIGSGSAGFDFTKVCNSGEAAGEDKCPPNPFLGKNLDDWGCLRDNTTGLLWEIKTEIGLRSKNNTYSWYNHDNEVNGGESGVENGGHCAGSECDTASYIKAVNDQGLCGFNDWRLPTKKELLSIVDNARLDPSFGTRDFPYALSGRYWTSMPTADQKTSAWQVDFKFGEATPDEVSKGNYIRLVHGHTITFGLNNP